VRLIMVMTTRRPETHLSNMRHWKLCWSENCAGMKSAGSLNTLCVCSESVTIWAEQEQYSGKTWIYSERVLKNSTSYNIRDGCLSAGGLSQRNLPLRGRSSKRNCRLAARQAELGITTHPARLFAPALVPELSRLRPDAFPTGKYRTAAKTKCDS
jgi:hypothetical protein